MMTLEERLDKLERDYLALNDYLHSLESMITTTHQLMTKIQEHYIEMVTDPL